MADPAPSHRPHLGRVTSFDARRGLGLVMERDRSGGDSTEFEFHATAIADGTRSIELGTEVSFVVIPGHGGRYVADALIATGLPS